MTFVLVIAISEEIVETRFYAVRRVLSCCLVSQNNILPCRWPRVRSAAASPSQPKLALVATPVRSLACLKYRCHQQHL